MPDDERQRLHRKELGQREIRRRAAENAPLTNTEQEEQASARRDAKFLRILFAVDDGVDIGALKYLILSKGGESGLAKAVKDLGFATRPVTVAHVKDYGIKAEHLESGDLLLEAMPFLQRCAAIAATHPGGPLEQRLAEITGALHLTLSPDMLDRT